MEIPGVSQIVQKINDKHLRILASIGLAIGGLFGMAGSFAPSTPLRSLAWGIDGTGLVMASALLTLKFFREGKEIVAAGFLVFAIGEGVILSGAACDLPASVPSFGAGTALWAMALALISMPKVFPFFVRILGIITTILFTITAGQIFAGIQLLPISIPLPFFAYPVFVATFIGWIWALLKRV